MDYYLKLYQLGALDADPNGAKEYFQCKSLCCDFALWTDEVMWVCIETMEDSIRITNLV